ncbi:hypothetical protein BN1723_011610 [Verticillium longisporum]|uniref:Sodium/calcium exchanger membrane region domain-containing protein n=2 Tax=Verticillium longisporum TaxID=100787 RepID=A0A0G4L9W6_VERLO|nr:hypothetical protein BN1723_011610 [Verticillium longisporum]
MDPSDRSGTPSNQGESSNASPTDTRRPTRYESYGAGRDEGLSESFQSFQSTETVRRRPEAGYGTSTASILSTGSMQSSQSLTPQYPGESSAHDRAHSRSTQPVRSPMLGPDRVKASRTRKPPMPRRPTNPAAPHRGEVFSTEDDLDEVAADAAERHREHHHHQQSYSTRRRPQLGNTLSRVQSSRSEPEENDDEQPETPRADDEPAEEMSDDASEAAPEEDIECQSDGDISDAESFTLKDRQQAINETHPFGIRLWKPALYKKDRSVQKTAEGDIHSSPGLKVSSWLVFFNLLWTILFGWWMATFAALGALVCFFFAATPSGREYGRVLWGLAGYLFYPFGKYVRLEQDDAYLDEDQGEGRSISEYEQWQSGDLEYGRLFFGPERNRSIVGRSRRSIDSELSETDSLLGRSRRGERSQTPPRLKRRLFGRGQWNIGRVTFFLFFYFLLTPSLIIVSLICWFFVFTIPMGKVTMLLFDHLRRHPLALSFDSDVSYARLSNGQNASSKTCYTWISSSPRLLSSQSSMGLGAAINAFFSTIVEVFLYCVALKQGKGQLVEGSIVGSIFAGILFLPGLSMCFGAIKRKTQRFNAKSAGVTSTMLLFAVIGAFGPTLFYQIYGTHELNCLDCLDYDDSQAIAQGDSRDCRRCYFSQAPALNDRFYLEAAPGSSSADIRDSHLYKRILGHTQKQVGLQPRSEDVTRQGSTLTTGSASGASGLPHQVPPKVSGSDVRAGMHLSGLSEIDNNALAREVAEIAATAATFAARDARLPRRGSGLPTNTVPTTPRPATSRAAPFPEVEDPAAAAISGNAHGGHDAPNWSRLKSSIVLMGATVLYAIVAEILVDTVDVVLEGFAIDEKFLGITLFALVPNTTEFLNAISFAMNGNIALSMEIGSAYALQVCLLQVPALVFFSAFYPMDLPSSEDPERYTFALLFPEWDMVLVILCVFLLSYMYGEGKSNYFKGSILLLSYLVVIVGYYFSGYSQDAMGPNRFDIMGNDGAYKSFKTIGRRTGGAVFEA